MKCGEVTHARELRVYLQSNLKPEKARGLVTSGPLDQILGVGIPR